MKPIIFNSEMVKAILSGRKTQTRRVIKPQVDCDVYDITPNNMYLFETETTTTGLRCPYGKPGDKLYIREKFAFLSHFDPYPPRDVPDFAEVLYYATDGEQYLVNKWRPSIYMPKWASRITLKIKDIRVERVQDITDCESLEEGITALGRDWVFKNFPDYAHDYREWDNSSEIPPLGPLPRERFEVLWNSINEKRGYGWDMNPWVFVVEFEKI